MAPRTSCSDSTTATSWTLIDVLRDPSAGRTHAHDALAELTARYYPAVRNLVKRIAGSAVDADDVTQDFFTIVVMERQLFMHADRDRGRFRHLLSQSVRHFVVDALRRGGRYRSDVRPDGDQQGWDAFVPPSQSDPLDDLIRDWGRTLVVLAIERLEAACRERGQMDHFRLFSGRFLSGEEKFPSWSEVGAPLGLDEKIARSRAEVAVSRFRLILKEMIASDPGASGDFEEELRALIAHV